jgi:predicted membrane protein
VEFDRQKIRDQMREHMHPTTGAEGILSARFVMGLVIISLGALFLFDSFGWIESRYILRKAWPLIFVAIGISILSRPGRGRRKRNEGWVFIIVGLWIFISKIGLLDFSFWGILFPCVLLFVGGMLVYRSLRPPRIQVTFDPADAPKTGTDFSTGLGSTGSGPTGPGPTGPGPTGPTATSYTPFDASRQTIGDEDHAEYIRSFAILSGSELRPMSRPFRGADLTALLGGVKLDLTSARMDGDSARIDVIAFCGGIEIYVPPDWTVTSKVATLLGGFTDKRRPTTTAPTKTLILDGFAVMGGIEVKN